ncbi:MAG: sensor histidine kinase [Acidimicrobiia bacterium]|nr:sensor histidine kinase [Acidimicrobiia bacterium]
MRRFSLSTTAKDTIYAVVVLILGFTSRVEINDAIGSIFSREPDALNTALIVAQAAPVAIRRRWPRAAMLAGLAAFMVDRAFDYPNTLVTAGLVLLIHAVGTELPPRQSLRFGGVIVGVLVAFTGLGALTLESVGPEDLGFTALTTAIPLALGREVYQRRKRIEELEERAERAEREREEQAARAVADERARIARELHDVVAHKMTVMTLQAEGARRVAGTIDPRVTGALDAIREAGHEALSEMRRMVGVLRTDPEHPSLTPQPGLADLASLAADMTEAGVQVTIDVDDTPQLPDGVDVNVYRIIQESLTNSLRHGGPGVTATVRVKAADDCISVEVCDDGRGVNLESNGGGHGLVGMRERVTLLGGKLDAGPRPGGGFRVVATIPVES